MRAADYLIQVADDYAGPVKVWVEFYYRTEDMLEEFGEAADGKQRVYASVAEAKAAIEFYCPSGELYRLGHGECDRPSFYIVAA